MRWLLVLLVLPGCVRSTVDRFATQRVIPLAIQDADIERTCAVGVALGHPFASVTRPGNPARRTAVIADATAAICAEPAARAAELDAALAHHLSDADARIRAVKDARERERRARAVAARRFFGAWQQAEAVWGPFGGECARVRDRDELTLLVGLVSGALAMVHDKSSGSTQGVPLDTLGQAGRAASCLDDARWWHVPSALQAASWAAIPGSGPEGVDPWDALEQAARAGEGSGVRLGWALLAWIAGNAGDDARVDLALRAAADSFARTPTDPANALFDQYALEVLRHQSDLRWATERGHRTERFGDLPEPDAPPAPPGDDPFAEDPFSEESP